MDSVSDRGGKKIALFRNGVQNDVNSTSIFTRILHNIYTFFDAHIRNVRRGLSIYYMAHAF